MPETTITTPTNKPTKATFTPPVLHYCPTCGVKLTENTVLSNPNGDTVSGAMCPKCHFVNKPDYRKASTT